MHAVLENRCSDMTLRPLVLCETQGGNLAYVVGRLAFQPGRPFLVEHVGGIYLAHDFCGRVLTPGHDDSYRIVALHDKPGDAEMICAPPEAV